MIIIFCHSRVSTNECNLNDNLCMYSLKKRPFFMALIFVFAPEICFFETSTFKRTEFHFVTRCSYSYVSKIFITYSVRSVPWIHESVRMWECFDFREKGNFVTVATPTPPSLVQICVKRVLCSQLINLHLCTVSMSKIWPWYGSVRYYVEVNIVIPKVFYISVSICMTTMWLLNERTRPNKAKRVGEVTLKFKVQRFCVYVSTL